MAVAANLVLFTSSLTMHLHGFWWVNLELLLLQCLSGRSLTREKFYIRHLLIATEG